MSRAGSGAHEVIGEQDPLSKGISLTPAPAFSHLRRPHLVAPSPHPKGPMLEFSGFQRTPGHAHHKPPTQLRQILDSMPLRLHISQMHKLRPREAT